MMLQLLTDNSVLDTASFTLTAIPPPCVLVI